MAVGLFADAGAVLGFLSDVYKRQLQNPTCEVEADSVVVTYLYNLQTSPAAECSLQYRLFGDVRIQTTLHYDPVEGLAAMPEFGVLFKIDADYDTVEWYGKDVYKRQQLCNVSASDSVLPVLLLNTIA